MGKLIALFLGLGLFFGGLAMVIIHFPKMIREIKELINND